MKDKHRGGDRFTIATIAASFSYTEGERKHNQVAVQYLDTWSAPGAKGGADPCQGPLVQFLLAS